MSAGLARTTSLATVVTDLAGGDHGIRAWVHPGTNGWTKEASPNGGLFSDTKNRRYLTAISASADEDCGVQLESTATGQTATNAVASWGRPVRSSGGAQLIVAYRPSSL